MARLTNISDPQRPSFELSEEIFSIGRNRRNDLVLNHNQVSRRHAEIQKQENGYRIIDLDSRNGVYVNNLKVKEERLARGDVIVIGESRLLFEDDQSNVPETTPPASDAIPPENRKLSQGDIITATPAEGPRLEAEVLFALDAPRVAQEISLNDLIEPSQSRKLFLLYQVSSILNSARPLDELLKQTLDLVFQAVRADQGAVLLYNAVGNLEPRFHVSKKNGAETGQDLMLAIARRAVLEKMSIVCAGGCFDLSPKPAEKDKNASAICVVLGTQDRVWGAICLQNSRDPEAFKEQDLDLLNAVANHVALAIERDDMQEILRQGILLRANLERFHSPDVVSHILEHSKGEKGFHGVLKEREVTVLFSDISDFTSLIERLDPQEAATLINQYFDLMTGIIFKYKGTVDKFIGDAVMAIFGAPISHGNDAELALFSAIEMLQAMEQFKAGKEPRQKFDIRIGINTGVVLSGYMGSKQRIEYTVLGDPVNVAARLQHIAEPRTILVGEDTYSHVKGIFKFQDRGTTVLRGKKKETKFYEVIY